MDFLKKVWDGWLRFGRLMGDIVARVVLTLFYFTIVLPFGLITRFFGDPLSIKNHPAVWLDRSTGDKNLEEARRSY